MTRNCCKIPFANKRSIVFIKTLLSKVNTLALTLSCMPLVILPRFVPLRFYSRRDNARSIIHYEQALFFFSPLPMAPTPFVAGKIMLQPENSFPVSARNQFMPEEKETDRPLWSLSW